MKSRFLFIRDKIKQSLIGRTLLRPIMHLYRKIKILFKNNCNYLTSVTYKEIIKESNKRLKLNIYDYKRISKPYKKYRSNEIWYYNEAYGFSYILKKYAGYKDDYVLKFIATHGVRYRTFTGNGFSWEYNQNAPIIFTNSNFAKNLIEQFVEKKTKIISGSLQILYADTYYESIKFKVEKEKLGKNLLVFPAHSDGTSRAFYEFDNFINEINKIKNNNCFNSVTICLFWRDIARGFDENYIRHDFKITCAGHISDCNFFSRLRTIIELSDVVMANSDTSAMWYSLLLEKPFYLYDDDSLRFENSIRFSDPEIDDGWYEIHKINKEIKEIKKTFSEYTEVITNQQKILIDRYCDIKNFKSPDDIRNIFNESEQMYSIGDYKKHENKVIVW